MEEELIIRLIFALPMIGLLVKMSIDDYKTLQVDHTLVILFFLLTWLSSCIIGFATSPYYILESAGMMIVGICLALLFHRHGMGAQDGKIMAAMFGFFGLHITFAIILPLMLLPLGMRSLFSMFGWNTHKAFMPDLTMTFIGAFLFLI